MESITWECEKFTEEQKKQIENNVFNRVMSIIQ